MSVVWIDPYRFATSGGGGGGGLTCTASTATRFAPAGRSVGERLFGLVISSNASTQTRWTELVHSTISGEELHLFERTADGTSNDDLDNTTGATYYIVSLSGGGPTITAASAFDLDEVAAYSISVPSVTAPGAGEDLIFAGVQGSGSAATIGSAPAGYSTLSGAPASTTTMAGTVFTKSTTGGATGTSALTASGGSGAQFFAGTRVTLT